MTSSTGEDRLGRIGNWVRRAATEGSRRAAGVWNRSSAAEERLAAQLQAIETELAAMRQVMQSAGPANPSAVQNRLQGIEARLGAVEYGMQGGRSTYMGRGLVLVKAVVKGRNIAYLVEAEDRLISPWFIITGLYETPLSDFFAEVLRPEDHCLDIGANFGFFTCLFARFCPNGKVIGVEPDPRIHVLVRDNLAINGLHGIGKARQAAVCDELSVLTLHRRVGRSGNTSMTAAPRSFTDLLGEPPVEPFEVDGITVDGLARELGGRVDVMKVDVEGAEPLVFRGAAQAIANNPELQIVMEWSPGQISAAGFEVPAFLDEVAAMGLGFHDLDPGRTKLSKDVLLARPYAAGILITRKPR